jgi:serine/threonine protein phosphatase PrpC
MLSRAAACCARARPPVTHPLPPRARPGLHRLACGRTLAHAHRTAPSTAPLPTTTTTVRMPTRRRSRSRSPAPPRRKVGDGEQQQQQSPPPQPPANRGKSPVDAAQGRQHPAPAGAAAAAAPIVAAAPHHAALLHGAPLVFGAATARGARPYQEDRHVVVSPFHIQDPPFPVVSAAADGEGEGDGQSQPPPPPLPHCDYFAVFDGHSGADAAEHAAARLHGLLARDPVLRGSRHAAAAAGAAGDAHELGPAVAAALRACFHAVDAEILARARTSGGREGATALVALRMGPHLFTAHAGDARAVLRRAGGRAHRLTHDHKPSDPGERARVEAAGGRVEHLGCWRVVSIPADPARLPAGLAISRSLGDLDFKGCGSDGTGAGVTADPTVGRTLLKASDDVLILASDGLWDVLSDQQACDITGEVVGRVVREQEEVDVAAGDDDDDEEEDGGGPACVLERAAHAAARALVAAALARRSMDNITALCAVMPWAAHGVVEEGQQAGGARA